MDANKTVLILYLQKAGGLKEAYVQKLLETMRFYAKGQVISSEKDLLQVLNHTNLAEMERLILMTDDIVGPLYDLKPVFEKAFAENVDFWGIAKDHDTIFPYFLAFEAGALTSECFWRCLQECGGYFEFVENVRMQLLQEGLHETYFISANQHGQENMFHERLWETAEFLREWNAPFVWKGIFEKNDYSNGGDEAARNSFQYICEHSDYDSNLLWDYLLHTKQAYDIKNTLQLEYIIPSDRALKKRKNFTKGQAAIILHLYYGELLETCFQYIRQIPEYYDLFVVSANEELLEQAEQLKRKYNMNHLCLKKKENRGRDYSALLVACRDTLMRYEFVCFLHDKKSHAQVHPAAGRTWMNNMWENILKNGMYVRNVLEIFEENPRLGLLVPPEPFQSDKVYLLGNTWGENYENVLRLLAELGVEMSVDPTKPPLSLSSAFWCRTTALRMLFSKSYSYEDFPDEPMAEDGTLCHALERVLPYIAQAQGFYTAVLMEQNYASLRGSRLQQILMNVMRYLHDEQLKWDIQKDYMWKQPVFCFLNFALMHEKCFVFGNTEYTQICLQFLNKLKITVHGIIFPDGNGHGEESEGIPIFCVSELQETPETCGIIFAMEEKRAARDVEILKGKGYRDFLFFSDERESQEQKG